MLLYIKLVIIGVSVCHRRIYILYPIFFPDNFVCFKNPIKPIFLIWRKNKKPKIIFKNPLGVTYPRQHFSRAIGQQIDSQPTLGGALYNPTFAQRASNCAGWLKRLGSGSWEMGDGRWEMGDGRWEMGDGRWEMGDGSWELGGAAFDAPKGGDVDR
ncbi:hypothetical protein B484DRAFT_458048 [Ochromonadaceae sp. CCMP2298]|nr:hypothetical protein B484DRAFT_458048 [Ochromonadaceae sp. CCMP2298]